MRKAEGDELRRQVRALQSANDELTRQVSTLRWCLSELQPEMRKARALLGAWMRERFDRERYPVGTTRVFLKWGA